MSQEDHNSLNYTQEKAKILESISVEKLLDINLELKTYLNSLNLKIKTIEFKLNLLTGDFDDVQDVTDPSTSFFKKPAPVSTLGGSVPNLHKVLPVHQNASLGKIKSETKKFADVH